ncbi:hypothetical protein [Halomonas icarae]|uniref:Uncharacterized protein n=1 Tax=Halomonas icarae TaxID=2691040 RepID=A0A7X4VY12_9GAMM|nr:hypothetical protein [Halomonas icarae]MDR5902033.1 hypothetical protein [Halomonas icarae]NAW12267.1 hypothetical protein [Halomonas icarae]
MPHHLLRFSRELDRRLDALVQTSGLNKAELIERCLESGVAALEAELMMEGAEAARGGTSIDQLLRESGLGA